MAVKASRTSSSLNGLMIAITIFMGPIPAWARARRDRAFSTEIHHAEKFTTRAQPAPRESNAVPDRPCSLTDYERGPFRAFPESPRPALFGRAQSLIISAQNEGTTGLRHNRAYRTGRKTVFRWGNPVYGLAALRNIERRTPSSIPRPASLPDAAGVA